MPGIPEICTDAELDEACRVLDLKGPYVDVVRGIVDDLSDAEIAERHALRPNTSIRTRGGVDPSRVH